MIRSIVIFGVKLEKSIVNMYVSKLSVWINLFF